MTVLNIHQRALPAPAQRVGELLDSLSGEGDEFWPRHCWPAMEFDGPLAVGARGGHGPVRYSVEEYVPGQRVVCRFSGPKGFDGVHGCDVVELEPGLTELKETLETRTHGMAWVTWPLFFRPLHDALMQDALSNAERTLGVEVHVSGWSCWVKAFRWLASRGTSRSQLTE